MKSSKRIHLVLSGSGGSCVPEMPCQADSNLSSNMMGVAHPMPMSEDFHEIGNVKKVMGNVEKRETNLGKSSLNKPMAKADLMEDMQAMSGSNYKAQKEGDSIQAPIHRVNLKEDGPNLEGPNLGPIAMCFDKKKGWTSELLNPQSRHWKRLAREVHVKVAQDGGKSINGKREGPIPL